jgi:hypothetical protein
LGLEGVARIAEKVITSPQRSASRRRESRGEFIFFIFYFYLFLFFFFFFDSRRKWHQDKSTTSSRATWFLNGYPKNPNRAWDAVSENPKVPGVFQRSEGMSGG